MASNFAALEARLNMAVLSRLSNTDATLDGDLVTGIFDNAYTATDPGLYGMASTAPVFTLASAAVPASVIGKTLTVGETTATTDAVNYQVAASEPDGTGITRLLLERIA